MAIDYYLDCATMLSANGVAAQLEEVGKDSGVFDAPITSNRLMDGALTRLGTQLRVMTERPPQPCHPIVSGLGFTPTVGVGFRMAKGADVSDQQDDMLRLVVPLLDRIDGDTVLHFQFEEIWLLRRGAELTSFPARQPDRYSAK
ncbi:SitI3 family protein [Streptomyces sp. NPDC005485]|uniref:SitI3 family protein n=1 Tax=Streptomyces sp. NPDC005485 TaxID=3155591 RepID=UPI0033BD8276